MTYIFPEGFFSETLPTDIHPLTPLFSDVEIQHNCPVLSAPEREILHEAHTIAQAKKRAEIVKNGSVLSKWDSVKSIRDGLREWRQLDSDDRRILDEAIERIKPEKAAVLRLRYIEECTIPETAAELFISESTVKRWTNKALDNLCFRLDECHENKQVSKQMDVVKLSTFLSSQCLWALLTDLQAAVAISDTEQQTMGLICTANLIRRELKGRKGVQNDG